MPDSYKYIHVPKNWKFVKISGKENQIDLSQRVRHQECYLISEDNELMQENIDGSIFSLGQIEDITVVFEND